MKSIKQMAGELLLLFYLLQRTDPKFGRRILEIDHDKTELNVQGDENLHSDILKICDTPINVSNALQYLEEGGFIKMNESVSNVSKLMHGIGLTSYGIDVIEGIERGEQERQNFQVNFNIQVNNNVKVESLLKAEIGSLLKAALL